MINANNVHSTTGIYRLDLRLTFIHSDGARSISPDLLRQLIDRIEQIAGDLGVNDLEAQVDSIRRFGKFHVSILCIEANFLSV